MLKSVFIVLAALPTVAMADNVDPRLALVKPEAVPTPFAPGFEHRLTVKFHDGVRARLDEEGGLVSKAGRDMVPLMTALSGAGDAPVVFSPLIGLPRVDLDRIEREAAHRSGLAQPDLGGMFIVNAVDIQRVAEVLHESNLVEIVYFEPLGMPPPGWLGPDACFDMAPFTDGYFDRQGYHGDERGIGMDAAWAYPGGRGDGIRIADCEYGYRDGHEDLCEITPEHGIEVHPNVTTYGWHEHGTAVLGEMVGGDNGYGVTGLVPDAEALFFFEWSTTGRRRVEAITAAIASVDAGDVVLLEMQIYGPGGNYGPAELDPMVWTVTRLGVDRGVCVVAAAGNGNQNLDSSPYAEYMGRGDSGAIIVGAGSANGQRDKLGFSTYGSRVNVQGWGESVFTSGYGDFMRVGGDADQGYTAGFSGTSSASPIVASAVVSLQGIYKTANGVAMDPSELRQLLIDTGKSQGAGGHIGPLPDLVEAVDGLSAPVCPADLDQDGELTLFDFLAFQTAFDGREAAADFDGDGVWTLFDFLAFQTAFQGGCPE